MYTWSISPLLISIACIRVCVFRNTVLCHVGHSVREDGSWSAVVWLWLSMYCLWYCGEWYSALCVCLVFFVTSSAFLPDSFTKLWLWIDLCTYKVPPIFRWFQKFSHLTTVSSSRLPVGARFDRWTLRCLLFDTPTVHLVIGVSLSLELGSGTVSRPLCAQPTCPSNGSNGHWRRFCLFETAARLWLFCLRRTRYKFLDIHTYIHCYSVLYYWCRWAVLVILRAPVILVLALLTVSLINQSTK